MTQFISNFFQNAAAGWVWRRTQELGSLGGVALSFYLAAPPEMQAVVVAIITGKGGGLTVTAVIAFGWYVWTQIQSYRATTRAQVVTGEGKKIVIAPNTRAASEIEAKAVVAPKPRTLWERIINP